MARIGRRIDKLEGLYGLDEGSERELQERVLGEALARSSEEVLKALEEALCALEEGAGEELVSFDELRAVLPEEQARHLSTLQSEMDAVAMEMGLE